MKIKTLTMLTIIATILATILATPCTTFAGEEEKRVEVVEYEFTGDTEITEYTSVEKEIMTRSSSRPSTSYDLSERYYVINFLNVTDYTYSLVYFKPDSLGRVSIYTNSIISGGERIAIYLYKRNGNECVSSWYGNPQSIRGLGYSNLQASENYYFKFEVYEASSINGTGYIHHPDNAIPVD